GHDAVVYGTGGTPVHYARVLNYLGIDDEPGPDLMQRVRAQVQRHGAVLRDEEVDTVDRDGEVFRVTTVDGDAQEADYLVLAAGKAGGKLATQLGIEVGPGGVATDGDQRTTVDRVYAVGRLARPER